MKAFSAVTVMLALCGALAGAAPATRAAAPSRPDQSAGPVPSESLVNAAILYYLHGKNPLLNSRKPFKILSGPTLATGNTFAGNMEQAWLMCVVINAERMTPGPQQLEGKALYLRTGGGKAVVVPSENWQDSSPHC